MIPPESVPEDRHREKEGKNPPPAEPAKEREKERGRSRVDEVSREKTRTLRKTPEGGKGRKAMLLKIKDLKKSYRSASEEVSVLDGLNLEVEAGDSLVISGVSGSGKSTLLNLISGLEQVTEGSVLSCGVPVSDLKEKQLNRYRNRKLGFVFQFHFLLKEFSLLENVMLPALISGCARKEAREKAGHWVEAVGLSERAHFFPLKLSGGERQRGALARALMNDPELILADEPTGNLDEANSRKVEDLLFSLVEDSRKTLIAVSHDRELIRRGKRHAVLKNGRLEESS